MRTSCALALLVAFIGLVNFFSAEARAQVTCDFNGPSPDPVDPTLAPRAIAWVSKIETTLRLTSIKRHTVPAKADKPKTASEDKFIELQAVVSDWMLAAKPGTVEYFFRSAVGHGVNVQYETLMTQINSENAQRHQFWVDTEAARAAACLDLIHLPVTLDK